MLKHLIKSSVIVGGAQVLAKGIGFLTTLLLVRLLSPENYGKYLLVMSVYGLVSGLLNFRFYQGVVRYISVNKGNNRAVLDIIKSSFILEIIVGIISVLVIWFASEYFAVKFIKDITASGFIRFGVILVFFGVLFRNFAALFQALEKFWQYTMTNLMAPVLFSLLILGIFILSKSTTIKAMLSGQIIVSFITLIIVSVFLWKIIKAVPTVDSAVADLEGWTKKLFLFSILPFVNASISTLVYSADTYLIAYFMAPAMVAYYTVGYSFSKAISMISGPVTTVLYPRLGEEYGKGNMEFLQRVYHAYPKYLALLFSPVVVILYVFSPMIISLFYTSKYISSVQVFRIWLFVMLVYQMGGVCSIILLTLKKQHIITVSSTINLVLLFVFGVILIPLYGITGAAISALISYAASSVFIMIFTARCMDTKVKFFEILFPILFAIVYILFMQIIFPNILIYYSIISIIAFCVFYFCIVKYYVISDEEWNFIRSIIKK